MKNKMTALLKKSFTVPVVFWGLSMFANILNWLFNLQAGRILTKEEFGVITVFLSFQYLLSVPANALSTTISRFTTFYIEKGEREKHFYFFRQYWWLAWTVGGILLIFFLLFQNLINSFFGFNSSLLLLIFTPIAVPLFLVAFERGTLSGQLAFIWVGVLFVVEAFVKLAFLKISSYLAIPPGIAAIAALPISVIVAFFVSILLARSFHPLPIRIDSGQSKALKSTYKFLGNSIFAGLGAVLIFNVDILLVKHFFTSYEAGVYSTLSLLGKTLYFGAGSLISLLVPLTAKAQAKKQSGRVPFFWLLGLITFAGSLIWLSYLFIPELVVTKLLTEKSLVVIPYLATYSLAMLCLVLVTCFSTFNLAKENHLPARLVIIAAVAEAILIYFFHQSLGQVVNVVSLTLFALLLIVILVEILGITFETITNNLLSLFRLFTSESALKSGKSGKIRVLIFNWRDLKHTQSGGAEVYIHELGKRLVESNYEITLFTSNDSRCKSLECIDGVNIIRRGGFVTVYFWAALYYLFKFRGEFEIIIDAENGIPFFTPLYTKIPVILLIHHVHQDIFFKSLIPPFSWMGHLLETYLMPLIYKKSTVVTVSSSTAEDLLKELGLGNVSVVSNGVDIDKYTVAKKSESPLISYVGRLKKYKSVDVLLLAFKDILQQFSDAKLVIAGEGDYRQTLEKKSLELGISENVQFLGRIPEEDKIALLGQSWVMVQPSYMEGWGITCLEANACQTPVLASRVAGLKDAVSEGISGYLFEYGNYGELARKLKELITDKEQRELLGKTSRDWGKKYSWSKQAEKIDFLILKILKDRKSPVEKYSFFNTVADKKI